MPVRALSVFALAALLLAGCAEKKTTTSQLTERQRDSVLALQPIPGAPAVGAALRASDKAAAAAAQLNAQVDSLPH